MAKEFYKEEYVKANTYETPCRGSFTNLTGQSFGKISVISWAGINKYGDWKKARNVWWCKCSCEETDYFLVNTGSLRKGLTTSCGCNYKNNSGGGGTVSIGEASEALLSNYQVLKYKGRKHPCKVECTVCGEVENFNTFYSAQQRGVWCSCKDNSYGYYCDMDNIANKYNYQGVLESRDDKGSYEFQCMSCGFKVRKRGCEIKDKCPCHYINDNVENASAVYLLVDRNNKGIYKIGKGNEPIKRGLNIQKSVGKTEYDHDFYVYDTKWFSSEQVAFYVERLYHHYFKDKMVYKERGDRLFDGYSEVFSLTRQDFLDFNEEYKEHIDFLRLEDISYVVNRPFIENINVLKSRRGVGVFIPHRAMFFKNNGLGILKDNVPAKKLFNNTSCLDHILDEVKNLYYSLGDHKAISLGLFLEGLDFPFEHKKLLSDVVKENRHFKDIYELETKYQQKVEEFYKMKQDNLKDFIVREDGVKISILSFISNEFLALTGHDVKKLLKEGKSYDEIVSIGGYYKSSPLILDDGVLISIREFTDKYTWKVSSSTIYIKLSDMLSENRFIVMSDVFFQNISNTIKSKYER